MKINNRHILHRVNFDFNTSIKSLAFEKRSEIDSFLKDDLLPDIENLLEELASHKEIKRFESIDLELNVNSVLDFSDIKDRLIKQLRGKIENAESENFYLIENEPSSIRKIKGYEKQSLDTEFEPDKKLEINNQKSTQPGQLQNMQNVFLYFLETGQLHWYATISLLNEFIRPEIFQLAIQDKVFQQKITLLFSSDKNSLQRFVLQMENELIEKFILRLAGERHIQKKVKLKVIANFSQPIQNRIYELMISCLVFYEYVISKENYLQFLYILLTDQKPRSLAEKRTNQIHEMLCLINPGIRQFAIEINHVYYNHISGDSEVERSLHKERRAVRSVINLATLAEGSKTNQLLRGELLMGENGEISEQSLVKSTGQKSFYIHNAGLILVHPFLQNLFTITNCMVEKLLLPDKKSLAVHLLHYLATGEEQEFECNMIFEKYLCGIAPEFVINRKITLSDQEKAECDELLQSMIGHWTALKNSSPDTLRQMFLQRDGKLDLQQDSHKLYLSHQSYDILLDSLPWGISIVKLPWMTEVLYVTWSRL